MKHRLLKQTAFVVMGTTLLLPPKDLQADLVDDLKNSAIEFAKECDYQRYLDVVQGIAQNWDWNKVKDLQSWNPFKRGGIPVTDYISSFFQKGARDAAIRSAKNEEQSLVFQLEQTCRTGMQMYETNRIHQIVQAGHINVGNAISWMRQNFDMQIGIDSTSAYGGSRSETTAAYEMLTSKLGPVEAGVLSDSAMVLTEEVLEENLRATTDALASLEKIQQAINEAEEEMTVYAEMTPEFRNGEENAKKWMCPPDLGYPDPNLVPAEQPGKWRDGRPECGPVPPERAQQIMAGIQIQITQMRAIQQAMAARRLEVGAVRMIVDNHRRREERAMQYLAPRF